MTVKLDVFDGNEPALIVKYGNTSKKHFLIDHPSMILGRSRGCDVELEAQDVSSVHCAITRGPDGLTIRDLNSRAGTKVNGERIRGDVALNDSDLIQIGPFSFDVFVPAALPSSTPVVDLALAEVRQQLERAEQARDQLAVTARDLRRRLEIERAARRAVPVTENVSSDMEATHRGIAEKQDALERRTAAMEEYERELIKCRSEFEREQEHFKTEVREHEKQAAVFGAEQRRFEQERSQAMRELTALQAHLESRQQEMARHSVKTAEAQSAQVDSAAKHDKNELACFARFLRQYRARLQAREAELREYERRLNFSWQDLLKTQDRLLDEQKRIDAAKVEADRMTASSRQQNAQVSALLEGLARLYAESRKRHDEELQELRQAIEHAQGPAEPRVPRYAVIAPEADAAPPVKRGRLTERVNIAALLDRLGNRNA